MTSKFDYIIKMLLQKTILVVDQSAKYLDIILTWRKMFGKNISAKKIGSIDDEKKIDIKNSCETITNLLKTIDLVCFVIVIDGYYSNPNTSKSVINTVKMYYLDNNLLCPPIILLTEHNTEYYESSLEFDNVIIQAFIKSHEFCETMHKIINDGLIEREILQKKFYTGQDVNNLKLAQKELLCDSETASNPDQKSISENIITGIKLAQNIHLTDSSVVAFNTLENLIKSINRLISASANDGCFALTYSSSKISIPDNLIKILSDYYEAKNYKFFLYKNSDVQTIKLRWYLKF